MDGVLVRSEEAWFRVVAAAGVRFRGRPVTREEFAPTFGQGTAADIGAFGLACTAAELDRFYLDHFGEHAAHTWVDPEAADVLRRLSGQGLELAVVTNTMAALAREILDAAGLRSLVRAVACADEVPRAKPAPDLVWHALERLGRARDEAWMTGDSRYDREASRSAGVRFVGYRIDGDLRVESLSGLLSMVEGCESATGEGA